MTWFDTARFGMFIHWGHSSQQGIELSWPLVGPIFALPQSTPISVEQYHSSAATFDPQAFDPREWARMAKRAGMQYAVLTTKHHDGYAMWDTKTSGLLGDAQPVRPRHRARVRRRVSRRRAARRLLLLARRLAPPGLPGVHAGRRAVPVPARQGARSRSMAEVRRRHVRAGPRAADELRRDRRASGSTAAGSAPSTSGARAISRR